MSKVLYELRDMLMRELREITDSNGKMTSEKLDIIDKLTHSIKSIDTVCAMESSGYSHEGNSYRMGRYSYENDRSYNDGYNNYGNSYGNSYGHWGMPDIHYNYSREDGHSNMIRSLEDMMSRAQTDKEREAIKMCLDKLKS